MAKVTMVTFPRHSMAKVTMVTFLGDQVEAVVTRTSGQLGQAIRWLGANDSQPLATSGI